MSDSQSHHNPTDPVSAIRQRHADGDHYAMLGQAAIGELLREIDRLRAENKALQVIDREFHNIDDVAEIASLKREVSSWKAVAHDHSERLKAQDVDATRYRWLRSHIAATIITRFNKDERDWRPEKMDALVDSRLHLKPSAPDVGDQHGS